MPSISTRLGRRIYELRRASDYSQEELAERAGISASYLWIDRACRAHSHISKRWKGSRPCLDISIAEIFQGVG